MTHYTARQIAKYSGLCAPEKLHTAVSRHGLPIRPFRVVNGSGHYDRDALEKALICGELMRLGVPLSKCARLLNRQSSSKGESAVQSRFDIFGDGAIILDVERQLADVVDGVW